VGTSAALLSFQIEARLMTFHNSLVNGNPYNGFLKHTGNETFWNLKVMEVTLVQMIFLLRIFGDI